MNPEFVYFIKYEFWQNYLKTIKNNGIHNTLEAAVYGIPVIFGWVYDKFQEAVDLVVQGGAISVKNYDEFVLQLNNLLDNPYKAKKIGDIAGAFVASGRGATEKVLKIVEMR